MNLVWIDLDKIQKLNLLHSTFTQHIEIGLYNNGGES